MKIGDRGITVIVCGGRHYDDRDRLAYLLDWFHERYRIAKLVHGGAKGADTLAGEWAEFRGVECVVHCAEWERYGRRAGPIRNAEMLRHEPKMVIAFRGGTGTKNMVELSKSRGIEVIEVT